MEKLVQPYMKVTVDPMIPVPFRVTRVRKEIDGVKSIEMESSQKGISFRAGQFNMLYAFGVGEVPISVSSHPALSEKHIIHTIRSVGLTTDALCHVKPGSIVGVRGPFGSYWPIEKYKGRDLVLIAGGLGLAPIRPALLEILDQRECFGRMILLYGTRTPQDFLFRSELLKWRKRFDLEIFVTVDHADSNWKGNVGVVPALISRLQINPVNTVAFICGPEIMMRFTIRQLSQEGLGPDQIYISMERNMRCATGFCGHCQFGPMFLCKDGPIFQLSSIESFFRVREM